jgi:transcriptional regulator with XRE-family HTH domain
MGGHEFSDRLARVLAALNMSRGRLAAAIGVDKSVVGRWTRGLMRPSEHNLSLITGFVADRRPGFDMSAWGADEARFALLLAPPPPAATAEWLPVSAVHSAREMARDGAHYPGLYVQLRRRFNLPGEPFAELLALWLDGDMLRFSHPGAYWHHRGRGFILQHQIYLVGEDVAMGEGLLIEVLNSVSGGEALATDGVMTSVQGDRLRAPASTPVQLLRIADLPDPHAEPAAAMLLPLQQRLAEIVEVGGVAALAGPEIIRHITARVGSAEAGGEADHLLRMPATRGFTGTVRDAAPMLRAAAGRWREALALPAGV